MSSFWENFAAYESNSFTANLQREKEQREKLEKQRLLKERIMATSGQKCKINANGRGRTRHVCRNSYDKRK